jgi:hypothetical protein
MSNHSYISTGCAGCQLSNKWRERIRFPQAQSGRDGVACAGRLSDTPATPQSPDRRPGRAVLRVKQLPSAARTGLSQSPDRRPGRAVLGAKQLPSAARTGLSQSPDRRPGRAVLGAKQLRSAARAGLSQSPDRRPGRAVLGDNYEMFRRVSRRLWNSRLLVPACGLRRCQRRTQSRTIVLHQSRPCLQPLRLPKAREIWSRTLHRPLPAWRSARNWPILRQH